MKVLIFDTETTGLWANTIVTLDKQPKIIEFYGCVVDSETFEIVTEFETFCHVDDDLSYKRHNKGGGIEKSITEITGITNEMLIGAPKFFEVYEPIKKLIECSDVGYAHNAVYDIEVIGFDCARIGKQINFCPMVDTVEKTEWVKGYRLSLSDLHEFLFGERFDGAHRARQDVMALKSCLKELKERDWI